MASSSKKSAVKFNLLGKRNPEDDNLETKPFLKKRKETSEEKEAAITKKTLFMGHLCPQTKISDIIDFFKDVVQVVRVRLFVTAKHTHVCCGLVEFSSTNEAKKAVEKKNGEYLLDYRIHLKVHKKNPNIGRPMFCIDHTVCFGMHEEEITRFLKENFSYKDYLRPESLPVEDSEAVKGLDETPHFVEEVLFVANISPQTKLFQI
ncbi:PREDICTED: nucleolin 2-like [Camelina sativa]|uniref:Nucleolin 2-like n=1 Tax=Camelina sativa TaxID=90675 RepID=A0ABM1QNS5_CAMSA|nr:PREDICTED: nucleolin 2-like [Camelina sativa]